MAKYKYKSWIVSAIHVGGFVWSSVMLGLNWNHNTAKNFPPNTFSSSHVVERLFNNPMDHSYIAFDANVHPFHHYLDTNSNAKYMFDVNNKCFFTGESGPEYCGMLPWQNGEILCSLTAGAKTACPEDSSINASPSYCDLKETLKTEGFKADDFETTLVNMLQDKGLALSKDKDDTANAFTFTDEHQRKVKDICHYESYMGSKVLVNEDSAFSLTSTHSVWVLWSTIWIIMALSFAMSFKNGWMFNRDRETEFYGFKTKQWNAIIDAVALIAVLVLYLVLRSYYADDAKNNYALLKPNGSFAYSLLAIIYSWVFLRTSTACNIENEDASKSNWFSGRKVDDGKPIVNETSNLTLDMSNFSNKIKADAYVQAGNGGRYLDEKLSSQNSFNENLDLQQYSDAFDQIKFSHFQMTQLWTFPFLALIVYIYDKNYEVDINVTLVFVLTMGFCILDVFSKRLVQLQEVIAMFEKTHIPADKSVMDSVDKNIFLRPSSFLVLAQVVVILVQALVYWYIYHFFVNRDDKSHNYDSNTLNFGLILQLYYSINVIMKLVRVGETMTNYVTKNASQTTYTQRSRNIFSSLKKHHVYENVCLVVLFFILYFCYMQMSSDFESSIYNNIKSCSPPDQKLTDKSCKLYYKWMNNYDMNSATGVDIATY
jgi:hypothetical protein